MPIKLNGTTFNNGGTVTFNGQTVKEIKFGTTTVWKAETPVLSSGTYASGYSGTYRGNLNGNTGYNPFSYTAGSGIKYDGGLASGNTRAGNVYINQQINASNFSSITFKFSKSGAAWSGPDSTFSSGRFIQFGLASATGSATTAPTFTASKKINSGSTISASYTIDISGQTGNQYIAIWTSLANSAYSPYTITDIILA